MLATTVWSTCLVPLNFARCTVARAAIKKMGWDTGLKGMLKITAAPLGNGDHVIVEIVECPKPETVQEPCAYS
jgi:hypothetical protein